jgi:hypothetical protein
MGGLLVAEWENFDEFGMMQQIEFTTQDGHRCQEATEIAAVRRERHSTKSRGDTRLYAPAEPACISVSL